MRNTWTPGQVALLKQHWGKPYDDIVKLIGRNKSSIKNKGRSLGLPFPEVVADYVFTDVECKWINGRQPSKVEPGYLLALHEKFNEELGRKLTYGEFVNARRRALDKGRIRRVRKQNEAMHIVRPGGPDDAHINFTAAIKRQQGLCSASGCREKSEGRYCMMHVGYILNSAKTYESEAA